MKSRAYPFVTFYAKIIVGVHGKFRLATAGFQNTLSQLNTGGNTGSFHFFDGDVFVFSDKFFPGLAVNG